MKSLYLTFEDRVFNKMLKAKKSYGKISWERFVYIMIQRDDVPKKNKKMQKV